MTSYTVKRLALVLAVQAEIEGMKATNNHRLSCGESIGYSDYDFCQKAEELRALANKHDEQL